MKNRFKKWYEDLTLTNSHSRHGTCKNGGFERVLVFPFGWLFLGRCKLNLFQGMQVVSRLS